MRRLLFVVALLLCAVPALAIAEQYGYNLYGISGVCPFFGMSDPNAFKNAEKGLALMKEAGVTWDRSGFWWGPMEPKPGVFDWSFSDRVAAMYKKSGMRMFGGMGGSSAWSNGKPPQDDAERALCGEWYYQTVNRYKDSVHVWEVWNEPNIPSFWKPQPAVEEYTKLLKVVSKRAKEADPKALIVGGSTSFTDFKFFRQILDNGGWDSFDIAGIHPYSMAGNPSQAGYKTTLTRFKEYVKPKPVWITETGWTTNAGQSLEEQALSLAQSFAISAAVGVECYAWFCLSDWGPNDNWGILSGSTKKPSFQAYKNMANKLGDSKARFAHCDQDHSEVLFTDPRGKEILMVWSNWEYPVRYALPCKGKAMLVTGEPVSIADGKIDLKNMPTMVFPDKGTVYAANAVFEPIRRENLLNNGEFRFPGSWGNGRHTGQYKDAKFSWEPIPGGEKKVPTILDAKSGAWISDPAPIYPGKRYTATARVKTEKATGSTRIQMAWWGEHGWACYGDVASKSISGDNDWTTLEVSGIPPRDCDMIRVELVSEDNTGKVWFDDIRLTNPGKDAPIYW